MSWEAISIHIGLINFAVAAILNLQVYQEENQGRTFLGKIAFFLFVLATAATTLGLFLHLNRQSFNIIAARGLVLAAGLSWLAIIAHLWLKMRGIGAFIAPAATLTLLLHFFISPAMPADQLQGIPAIFLAFHIAGATMGQILAIAASVISVLYLWQQRVLKHKLLTQLTPRLPALDMLERLLVACLWTGFLFLTSALLSGALYLQVYSPDGTLAYTQKIAWAITVWVWYLATLLARNVLRVSVKRVAQMSLVGFALLAMTFFGLVFFDLGVALD